jgi:myo-inositol-1(or 4)-monophosphatase
MKETENNLKKTAVEAALQGGKILKKYQGKVKNIGFKGEVDLVTEVDRLSEDKIIRIIKRNFPEHGILTEESKGWETKSEYQWVIDPLDGTTNYAHNFPTFCVSVALEKSGKIVLGAVFNPVLDELFWTIKGKGAFLNKKRIFVSQTKKLSQSLLATGFPYDIRTSKENNLNYFANFAKRAQAVRRAGSAALDLCYLAMGRFDGFWELKLHPWDTAVGALLVEEAGGKVTDFRGKEFNIYLKEILATNGWIHKQMLEVIAQS